MQATKKDLAEGKSASTAAGEFVREEIDPSAKASTERGQSRARSIKQAIAIGLSKARRAGIPLKQPSAKTTRAVQHLERLYGPKTGWPILWRRLPKDGVAMMRDS